MKKKGKPALGLSSVKQKDLRKIVTRYADRASALMPVLFLVQEEKGHINLEDQRKVAEFLGLQPVKVRGVVEFYTMFRGEKCGKYLIQVCHTLSCAIRGAKIVTDTIAKKLKISVGETTPDGKFTLVKVECLGSCGTAPVMQINDDYYENLTEEKIYKILDSLE